MPKTRTIKAKNMRMTIFLAICLLVHLDSTGQTVKLFGESVFTTNILPECVSEVVSDKLTTTWDKTIKANKVVSVKQTHYTFQYGEKLTNENYIKHVYDDIGQLSEKGKVFKRGGGSDTKVASACKNTFDDSGNVIQTLCMDVSPYAQQVMKRTYTYENGRLISETSEMGEKETYLKQEYEIKYNYNEQGHLIEESKKFPSGLNNYQIKYEYNDQGHMTKKVVFLNDQVSEKKTFQYDNSGNLSQTNQLDKKQETMRPISKVKYDANNNVIQQDYYYNCGQRYQVWKNDIELIFSYEYDSKGNLTEIKIYGNTKSELNQTWKYKYDEKDNLIEVTQYDINNKPILVVSNEYSY